MDVRERTVKELEASGGLEAARRSWRPGDFLAGGGTMGGRIRGLDWSATPLGPTEGWPQSLRSALSICLHSSFPTAIYWGPELRLLYNDAWAPIPADKHPWALGRPAREVWADIWHVIEPQFASVVASGEGFSAYDQMLPMRRGGTVEETYWNYSLTPIRGEDGRVAGVFNQGHETTARVLQERRRAVLLQFAERARELPAPEAIANEAVRALGEGLNVARVGYGEVDDAEATAVVEREWTDGSTAPLAGETGLLDRFGPALVADLRFGRTARIDDVRSDPRTSGAGPSAAFAAIGARATLLVPLLRSGRLRVVLYLMEARPRAWTAAEATLAEEVASRTWDAVERARAEARLDAERDRARAAEERLRLMADALPGLICYVDAERRYRFSNQAYHTWFGHSHEAIEGRHVREVIGDAAYAELEPFIAGALAGERVTFERAVSYRTGGSRYVTGEYIPSRAADGRIDGYYAFVQDVTARKKAELALAESEARFRHWADSAPVILWVTEADGRCSYLSRRWYEFTGQTEATGLGFGWLDAVHPEDDGPARATFEAAHAAREPFRLEYRLRHVSGEYRWAIDAAAPRFGANGAFLGFVGSVIDITERKMAEAQLRVSEAQFRELADHTPQIIWAATPGVGNDYLNRRWYEFTGAPAGEVGTESWRRYLHPDDVERVLTAWDASSRAGEPFEVEYRFREVASGRYRWQLGRGLPVRDSLGDITRWLGTCTDIDDQKQAEERLRELNETLERRVAERTAELAAANRHLTSEIEERRRAEAALSQAQKIEAVGQLTAGVAHDFNNLLTVVTGNLNFLGREVAGNPRAERRIAHMRIAAERGAKLTTQLLAFSRNQRLAPRPVALNETVADMGDLLRATIGGAVSIDLALHPGLSPAMVDPTQIELAVLNLAINARDAMEGGGTLTIETANVIAGRPTRPEEPPPGEYVMIAVVDTGSGMRPEVLAQAFEPFFTTKQVGKGSGLGLAQVSGLAKQSGGGVRVTTELGVGTRVEVYLPRATAPVPVTTSPEVAAAQPHGDAVVLLVDDDDEVRAVTAESLVELGYRVIEAGSGARALDILEQEAARIEVVVLDYAMPGMNGAELARRVGERRPDLPVVFVTGYAERTALDGLAAHAAVIQKPFRPSELALTVQAALGPRIAAEVAGSGSAGHAALSLVSGAD